MKFLDGRIFIILNDSDITQKMINYSTSRSKDSMPSKTSQGVLKRILETQEPLNSCYDGFLLYDSTEVMSAWDNLAE